MSYVNVAELQLNLSNCFKHKASDFIVLHYYSAFCICLSLGNCSFQDSKCSNAASWQHHHNLSSTSKLGSNKLNRHTWPLTPRHHKRPASHNQCSSLRPHRLSLQQQTIPLHHSTQSMESWGQGHYFQPELTPFHNSSSTSRRLIHLMRLPCWVTIQGQADLARANTQGLQSWSVTGTILSNTTACRSKCPVWTHSS